MKRTAWRNGWQEIGEPKVGEAAERWRLYQLREIRKEALPACERAIREGGTVCKVVEEFGLTAEAASTAHFVTLPK